MLSPQITYTFLWQAAVETASSDDFTGEYEGTLPCADCEGIKTDLKLNEDGTYSLKSEYLGKEDAVFEDDGSYTKLENGVVVLVSSSTADNTYYKLVDGAVALSGSLGNVNEGELTENYKLSKK